MQQWCWLGDTKLSFHHLPPPFPFFTTQAALATSRSTLRAQLQAEEAPGVVLHLAVLLLQLEINGLFLQDEPTAYPHCPPTAHPLPTYCPPTAHPLPTHTAQHARAGPGPPTLLNPRGLQLRRCLSKRAASTTAVCSALPGLARLLLLRAHLFTRLSTCGRFQGSYSPFSLTSCSQSCMPMPTPICRVATRSCSPPLQSRKKIHSRCLKVWRLCGSLGSTKGPLPRRLPRQLPRLHTGRGLTCSPG